MSGRFERSFCEGLDRWAPPVTQAMNNNLVGEFFSPFQLFFSKSSLICCGELTRLPFCGTKTLTRWPVNKNWIFKTPKKFKIVQNIFSGCTGVARMRNLNLKSVFKIYIISKNDFCIKGWPVRQTSLEMNLPLVPLKDWSEGCNLPGSAEKFVGQLSWLLSSFCCVHLLNPQRSDGSVTVVTVLRFGYCKGRRRIVRNVAECNVRLSGQTWKRMKKMKNWKFVSTNLIRNLWIDLVQSVYSDDSQTVEYARESPVTTILVDEFRDIQFHQFDWYEVHIMDVLLWRQRRHPVGVVYWTHYQY